MPVEYRIDPDKRMVFCRAFDELTADDFLAFRRELRADAAFDPTYSQLFDLADVTRLDVGSDFIRFLTEGDPFAADARRAAVAQTDLVFGSFRMYAQMRATEDNIRTFRTLEEAEQWLGL